MYLKKNPFDLLLISFVFNVRNSLEKWADNIGVLLTDGGEKWCQKYLYNYAYRVA